MAQLAKPFRTSVVGQKFASHCETEALDGSDYVARRLSLLERGQIVIVAMKKATLLKAATQSGDTPPDPTLSYECKEAAQPR